MNALRRQLEDSGATLLEVKTLTETVGAGFITPSESLDALKEARRSGAAVETVVASSRPDAEPFLKTLGAEIFGVPRASVTLPFTT